MKHEVEVELEAPMTGKGVEMTCDLVSFFCGKKGKKDRLISDQTTVVCVSRSTSTLFLPEKRGKITPVLCVSTIDR